MTSLDTAIRDLQVLTRSEAATWRDLVRHQLLVVRQGLAAPQPHLPEAWLSARESRRNRERGRLLARVSACTARLGRSEEPALRRELARLAVDLTHFVQRSHDLVYDAVALDLGGSE